MSRRSIRQKKFKKSHRQSSLYSSRGFEVEDAFGGTPRLGTTGGASQEWYLSSISMLSPLSIIRLNNELDWMNGVETINLNNSEELLGPL